MKPALSVLLSALLCAACATSGRPSENATIEVYRSDESRQCQGGSIDTRQMRRLLEGIPVYAERKDQMQGVAFPAVCGGATGSINVYTIPAAERGRAEQLGFTALPPQQAD